MNCNVCVRNENEIFFIILEKIQVCINKADALNNTYFDSSAE